MMYNEFNMLLRKSGILVAIVLIVTGCAEGVVRYINPTANFSYIKKIAVLPFNNLSDDRYAGEKIRNTLIVDLMSRGVFEVVEQGEVTKVLSVIFREAGVEEGRGGPGGTGTLKIIGEKLSVQAVILGSVDEYSGAGGGNIVSIGARMLDTGSGIILWQTKATETGRGG